MSAYELSFPVFLRLPLRLSLWGYSFFIVWASLRPSGSGGAVPHLDKVFHVLVYAILAFVMATAWPKLPKAKVFWACVAFGGIMEVAQGVIASGRTASLYDGLANSVGAALGLYLASWIVVKFNR